MASFSVYNLKGEKVGTVDRPSFFEAEVDTKLIHRYLTWVRTMLRPTLAHTKTRGEVSGGGKKPWKQKGTGRARVGSTRSPLWRKGGITFGPRSEQTWATRMPRTERRKALFSALSAKALAENVVIVDAWNVETPKTKDAVAALNALVKKENAKILHVNQEAQGGVAKSVANLPHVTVATPSRLNVKSVLDNDVLVLTKDSLKALDEHFLTSL